MGIIVFYVTKHINGRQTSKNETSLFAIMFGFALSEDSLNPQFQYLHPVYRDPLLILVSSDNFTGTFWYLLSGNITLATQKHMLSQIENFGLHILVQFTWEWPATHRLYMLNIVSLHSRPDVIPNPKLTYQWPRKMVAHWYIILEK